MRAAGLASRVTVFVSTTHAVAEATGQVRFDGPNVEWLASSEGELIVRDGKNVAVFARGQWLSVLAQDSEDTQGRMRGTPVYASQRKP